MNRPQDGEFAPAHGAYVQLVEEEDVLAAMQEQSSETQRLLAGIDDARATYRYQPEKWSIKEVIGHICDAERILGYRALAVARGESQPLPGFDEEAYVRNAGFDAWRIGDLAEQYALVRRATIVFFRNLPHEAWSRRGTANHAPVSVHGLAYVIVGHERHHLNVLRERYNV